MSADSDTLFRAGTLGRLVPLAFRTRLGALVPRFLFGVRLASSVCLALYVTYMLELPNPFWAATTAAIVCQPNLGASLQKGRFRALGTVLGALALVSLLALFPQQRIAFLLCLALWCGLCGAAVVLLRNSAAYAAALSGITAAILFADSIADPTTAFVLGIGRVSEICIGIAAAAVVMLLTEPGAARLSLAGLMERTALQLRAGFLETLENGTETAAMAAARRKVVKALTPLGAAVDAATGEAAVLYSRRGNFRLALASLALALVGWRNAGRGAAAAGEATRAFRRALAARLARINPAAPERQALLSQAVGRQAVAEIEALRQQVAQADPSDRLLADATRDVALCLAHFIDAVVFLRTGAGDRKPVPRQPWVIADSLPAWQAGARAVLSVLVVSAFWIATAWPSGAFAVAFAVISTLIFASFGDEARMRASDYSLGVAAMTLLGSGIYFFVLPALSTFPALMALLFLLYVPLGMMQVGTWHSAVFLAMSITALPLLGIGNPVAYDPAGYFNVAFAIFAGSAAGTLFFIILPVMEPAQRAARLIRLSVRDLRRLSRDPGGSLSRRWQALLTRRLESLPPQASLEQDGTLLALLAMGLAVIKLRAAVGGGAGDRTLAEALAALAQGRPTAALHHLEALTAPAATTPAPALVWAEVQAEVAVLAEAILAHTALLGPREPMTAPARA
ncbi:FUSC family protein [Aquabacter sp. L1I39]|uniref:FUSC family protein n=1 Tax=Aquabacter sp. L1I39 TaxID=2820278 RepID=UPI001AD993AC|nr:FUSC family protein [Aquabacter sp. L1I39]QTL04384.1 FUSC family protein [Aquabacter sp. L1I39]